MRYLRRYKKEMWGGESVSMGNSKPEYPSEWKKAFAWLPQNINGKRYWLTNVYTRTNRVLSEGNKIKKEYGDIFNVMKDS